MDEKKFRVTFTDRKTSIDDWEPVEMKTEVKDSDYEDLFPEDVETIFKEECKNLLMYVVGYAEKTKQLECLGELYRAIFAWDSVDQEELLRNFTTKKSLYKSIKEKDMRLLDNTDALFAELGFTSKAPVFSGQDINYLFTRLQVLVKIAETQ